MWVKFEDEKPPFDTLVIVRSNFSGFKLRYFRANNDIYDEEDILDDSEVEYVEWHRIPSLLNEEVKI